MKTTKQIALLVATLCSTMQALSAAEITSDAVVSAVQSELSSNSGELLQTVAKNVTATPQFTCEIVKTAVRASSASDSAVASIVEAAATAAPEQMRLAAQCAIAMSPDSADEVQQIIAKFDSAAGKDSTSGKEESGKQVADAGDYGNPLNFPTGGQNVVVGPTPNSPGSRSLLPSIILNNPPVIAGKPATGVINP